MSISKEQQDKITDLVNKIILDAKSVGWSTKDVSDQWHTFDELYYHRMILFLSLQLKYPSLSWKSKLHHDNTMFEDSFVVGIDTPAGQYSYHYNLKYWDLFNEVREVEKAPEYDGHMPNDVIRLLSLGE